MPVGSRVPVGTALCGVALALASASVAAGPPAATVLAVRLTATADTALATRLNLVREVESIWRRSGVRIEWLPALAAAAPDGPVLRVLVTTSSGARTRLDGHTWPVAELLDDHAGQAVALASSEAAREVLEVAGHVGEPTVLVERRLGIVLGRAVAHEIGHFLLGTGAHARRGLMRAAIAAPDFADLREGGFWLDAEATRWMRASAASGAGRLARFTYPR
jgi:hypothetical protein